MASSDADKVTVNGWSSTHHGDQPKDDIANDLVKLRIESDRQIQKGNQRSRRPESCSADDIRYFVKQKYLVAILIFFIDESRILY